MKLRQVDLADALGISERLYRQYESGEVDIPKTLAWYINTRIYPYVMKPAK
ncbi:helix-turn-helix domain-containing protein [Priestia flexa]|nr:helix-turn-helix domain-containing protein [Ferrimonas balearica]